MRRYAIELKWGLIFVAMALAWMLLEKLAGLHSTHIDKHATYTNLFALPAIVVYVLALRDKRNNFYGGSMSWKQGFVSGLIITAIVTVLSPLSQIITSEIISPEYFANAIEYAVGSGALSREAAEAYFNLKSYILQGLIGAPVTGAITSAIVAIFIRKKGEA